MPEGDTIRKLARALETHLRGQRVASLRLRGRALPGGSGVVLDVRAHGKHLWVDFAHGFSLRCHLGMYGSWHRYAPGEAWRKPVRQAVVELRLDHQVFVCFNPRDVQWAATGGVAEHAVTGALGPDLSLADPAIGDVVCRARRTGPGRRLVDVLLDQRIAAGIGNAYKSELLFLRRLAPDRTLGELDDEELRALFSLAGALIRANLGGGPRTTRFLSDRAGRLWVYRRGGEPCLRCGTLVRMARLGEDRRSTYWCPACQGTAQSTG